MVEYHYGRVVETASITARTRAIAIHSEAFYSWEFKPGIDLLIDTGAGERHYSVSMFDPVSSVARLTVVMHGGGPGAIWAKHITIGSEVRFTISTPQSISLDPMARWHIFFGDETSVGSSLALMDTAKGQTEACFEVIDPSDRWPDIGDQTVKWLFRGATRPGKSDVISEELAGKIIPEGSMVYVTGEAWLCAVVSSHFHRVRGFPQESIRVVPYWKHRPPLPAGIMQSQPRT